MYVDSFAQQEFEVRATVRLRMWHLRAWVPGAGACGTAADGQVDLELQAGASQRHGRLRLTHWLLPLRPPMPAALYPQHQLLRLR